MPRSGEYRRRRPGLLADLKRAFALARDACDTEERWRALKKLHREVVTALQAGRRVPEAQRFLCHHCGVAACEACDCVNIDHGRGVVKVCRSCAAGLGIELEDQNVV